jgi:hypothetical protein
MPYWQIWILYRVGPGLSHYYGSLFYLELMSIFWLRWDIFSARRVKKLNLLSPFSNLHPLSGDHHGYLAKVGSERALHAGLPHAYGTYDPVSGRARQVKAPATDKVFLDHLVGRQPYGVYLLVKDRTRAIAVDFDSDNRLTVAEFLARAKHYGIPVYVERS